MNEFKVNSDEIVCPSCGRITNNTEIGELAGTVLEEIFLENSVEIIKPMRNSNISWETDFGDLKFNEAYVTGSNPFTQANLNEFANSFNAVIVQVYSGWQSYK